MTDVFDIDESENKLLEEQAAQESEDQAALEAEDAEKEQEAEQSAESEDKTGEDQEESKAASQRVPLGELIEERKSRQAAQQELSEVREKYGRLEGRLEEIAKKLTPQEQGPSFDEDPAAALRHGQEQIQQQIAAQQNQLGEQAKHAEAQQAWQQFQMAVAADEQSFKQNNAHYDEAVEYLRETRRDEYRALGVTNPAQIEQWVQNDAIQIARGAMQQNKSVAQAIYDLASTRGYKPAEANGGDKSAAEKLAKLEQGQKASKSLSQAGGNTEIELSLEAIANMTDEEFAKVPDETWRKIMGA